MKNTAIPSRTGTVFASSGDYNSIAQTSTTATLAAGTVTQDVGFPPLTMTAISSGGIPPAGQDMNGILYMLSLKQQWNDAGMGYPFDATFATSISGYPSGSIIPASDYSGLWLSTTDANVTSPEGTSASDTGWQPLAFTGQASIALTSSSVTMTNLQAAKPTIYLSGTLTANVYLYIPPWIKNWVVENNCSGSSYNVIISTTATTGTTLISRPKTKSLIRCDGTNVIEIVPTHGSTIFTASGTFTVPSYVTNAKVTVIGGGGSGGGCSGSSTSETISGAGGGAGGTAIKWMTLTPGATYAVVIGAGGVSVKGAVAGNSGGQSSFGGSVIAYGGGYGAYNSATSTSGGAGGTASGGDVNITGGNGSDGQNGTFLLQGDGGASSMGGAGRAGSGGGQAGKAYGSGGGGAYDGSLSGTAYSSGAGAAGIVIIEY